MAINFTEIPLDNINGNLSDSFELFTRDFLQVLGYQITEAPGRGTDGGKDLIVTELLTGINGLNKEYKWLVSCKHYANSGSSVSGTIEIDISDRVRAFGCDGFMGFYSTIPSQGLMDKLNRLSEEKLIPYQIYDQKVIEKHIVGNSEMDLIFMRYFPKSYKDWKELNNAYESVKLFEYFLDKEFLSHSMLSVIFKSKSYLLKLLRNSNSLEELLAYENIQIEIAPNLYEILDEDWKCFDYKNRPEQLREMNYKKILYEKYGIAIKSNVKSISLQLSTNLILLFNEVIVMDNYFFEELNKHFIRMKSII
jgi:hypothetical protein